MKPSEKTTLKLIMKKKRLGVTLVAKFGLSMAFFQHQMHLKCGFMLCCCVCAEESSVQSSKSHLSLTSFHSDHYMTVLTGEMHKNASLIRHSNDCNLLHFISHAQSLEGPAYQKSHSTKNTNGHARANVPSTYPNPHLGGIGHKCTCDEQRKFPNMWP